MFSSSVAGSPIGAVHPHSQPPPYSAKHPNDGRALSGCMRSTATVGQASNVPRSRPTREPQARNSSPASGLSKARTSLRDRGKCLSRRAPGLICGSQDPKGTWETGESCRTRMFWGSRKRGWVRPAHTRRRAAARRPGGSRQDAAPSKRSAPRSASRWGAKPRPLR